MKNWANSSALARISVSFALILTLLFTFASLYFYNTAGSVRSTFCRGSKGNAKESPLEEMDVLC